MKRPLQAVLLLVPVLVLLAINAPTNHFLGNQYDDSYITYRYAINLAEGKGLVFNLGEHTDSASSFLYTVVLALFKLLRVENLELVGALLGVLSLGCISLLVYRLAAYLSSDKQVALLASVACGLNGLLGGWALSGMETLPWVAIVLTAIYLLVTEAHPAAITVAIVVAVFTRFEGILLVGCWLTALAMRGDFSKKKLVPPVGVVLAFALFYVVKYQYYGVWISHAFQLKEIAHYYQPAPRELIHDWVLFGSVPVLLSIPSLVTRKHLGVTLYICANGLLVLAGPRSDWSRYSVHLLPLFYAFSAPVLSRIMAGPRGVWRNAFIAVILSALGVQALSASLFGWRNMASLADHQRCRKDLGRYIRANVPESEFIASSDIGAISYIAINHHFVDLIGLTSADVLAGYENGQTPDDVLVRKHVKYIADTFSPNSANRIDKLLKQFPSIKNQSAFMVDTTSVEFACMSEDGLSFRLAKIRLKADASPKP